MYYLYHIPGKKIGVTCNLNRRVTLTQGYSPDEYEVLDQSDDIDYISEKEIELQKSYGYKVDRKKYNELIKLNKMKINVTEQTTTFPYPVKKLKGHLMDNIGMQWKTEHGLFVLNIDSIRWIEKNVKTSFYNDSRSDNVDTYVNVTLSTGNWYYFGVSRDNTGSNVRIWINGVSYLVGSGGSGVLTPGQVVHIGVHIYTGSDSGYFTGSMNTIKFYNRALSSTEVKQNFEAHRSRFGV